VPFFYVSMHARLWLLESSHDADADAPRTHAEIKQNPRGKGTGMGFESAWASLPHPVKAYRGGEDVQMACSVGDVSLIGVFDGVGEWQSNGKLRA
jgi:hypothetical protein